MRDLQTFQNLHVGDKFRVIDNEGKLSEAVFEKTTSRRGISSISCSRLIIIDFHPEIPVSIIQEAISNW